MKLTRISNTWKRVAYLTLVHDILKRVKYIVY
jgi:hypothetical protein